MKNKHITHILDQKAFAELNEAERKTISIHIAESDCADCRKAFAAARVSADLIKCADAVEITPSPFFQAKVMNAWRERQQLTRRPVEAFRRWWQASAVPVFMMLAVMAVLVSLTILAPQSSANDMTAETSSFNLYTTESVILNQKPSGDLTNEQVFQVIYSARASDARRSK